jgi:ubiquinone/menaquinone biosynthesis C-methylase UbiE
MIDSAARSTHLGTLPPRWAIQRPKSLWRGALDFATAPIRMTVLPDHVCERLRITSLRGERLAVVLPEVHGRLLDIGAGDNVLVTLYKNSSRAEDEAARSSVGADVVDWGGGCTIIESSAKLPFDDRSFDTVAFVACLNHIPERQAALQEAHRVLRPGGRIVITMISRFIGTIGHKIWWYSEDKERHLDEHEEMGLDLKEVLRALEQAGLKSTRVSTFLYGLNTLYVAEV